MPHQVTKNASARGAGSSSAEGSPRPAVVSTPGLNPRAPAGLAVVHALEAALSRIGTHELAARRGDPEGVHRLRSASRRLRSELDALEEFVLDEWRERAESELKWLAGLLGEARDLDILLARLRDECSRNSNWAQESVRKLARAAFHQCGSPPRPGWATCCALPRRALATARSARDARAGRIGSAARGKGEFAVS